MPSSIVKKIIPVFIALIVTGCSALPTLDLSLLNPGPSFTPAPSNTPLPTVTLFPTSTPTKDLFAVNTLAPAQPTATANMTETAPPPTRTPTATSTLIPTITLPAIDESLFTPGPKVFRNPQFSTSRVVWGSTCEGERSIKFTVDASYVGRLKMKYVLLFTRLQDKYSARNTDWQTGAIMLTNDQGRYFYTLELDQIENYMYFEDAWLQFQFVASSAGLTPLGRSVVDQSSVSITHCSFLNTLPPLIHNPFTTLVP